MAELFLRVIVARAAPPGEVPVEVAVTVDESHTVGELARSLAAHVGVEGEPQLVSRRLGRALDPLDFVARVDLLTGDDLLIGPPVPSRPVPPRPVPPGSLGPRGEATNDSTDTVAIDVVAGPETGRSQLVRRPGRYVVGRARDVSIAVDDPSVSRRHLAVDLDVAGTATVHPRPAAANGVLVNGVEVTAPTVVRPTDVVTLGGTRIAVRPVPRPIERRATSGAGSLGRVDVHRTPYRPIVVPPPGSETIGPVPDRFEPRRLPAAAIVAPLAAGLVLYAFTRQVHFLALTLLSPLVMVGSAVEERRSGRRDQGDRIARFRSELAGHRERLAGLRDRERIARLRASPDLADLIRRAELRTVDLWARGRSAPDFGSVRIGLGPARASFSIELERCGDDDLRDEAVRLLRGLDQLTDVPVTVVLDNVFAVHGAATLVDGVAASLLVQAAVLHSPEDLVIAAAVAPGRPLDWVRWLPHSRSVTSPLPGDHLAIGPTAADHLIERLIDVAESRVGRDPAWPRVLVLIDRSSSPDAANVARLLDVAPSAGMAVVWLAASDDEVPRQATRTLIVRQTSAGVMRGRVWSVAPDDDDVELEVEHVRPERAARLARSLAPVRDASTVSLASTIPRSVGLLDVFGVGRPSAAWVVDQWHHGAGDRLRFPIGRAADGPLVLDLVEDGPHALVGGTSGAGKSELLQAMVASLAAHHPPTRLNFLFVDYKGGAASQVFERLPHTVGYVTNLSADLAERALTSLRAELHRRMVLFEGRAKDLEQLRTVAPDDSPPSLVIVVDEFATLVREVPEFVTGIVDIAQRGRSLGIHLVLATQRPSGSVNENILANTNLRIALRMLDRAESSAVVGVPDAADIPVPLRGRGVARLGPRRLVEFQTAFPGAPLVADGDRPAVLVAPFTATDSSPAAPSSVGSGSQLDAVLDAIVEADRALDLPPPSRPWREVLPTRVALDTVLADPVASAAKRGRHVVVGLVDVPERQEQHAAVVDLEAGGGLLVFGSGGAGLTTLIRTVAASIAARVPEGREVGDTAVDDVAVVVFDAAGRGCAGLDALAPVVEVVSGDDLEAVTRILLVLERELERRRRASGDGASVDGAVLDRASGDGASVDGAGRSRLIVLIDGFGALVDSLADAGGFADDWSDRLVRLVVEGRQVGIHTVLTADRRNAVPARIHAAVANRIVLRHADDAGYADHGIRPDRARSLTPGRGWWFGPGHAGPVLVQIATTSAVAAASSSSPSAPSSTTTTATTPAVAATVQPSGCRVPWVGAPLPEHDRRVVRVPGDLTVAVGPADVCGRTAVVDLDWSHFAVFGPARSGRSTMLASVALQLAGEAAAMVVVGGPTRSPLRDLAGVPGVVGAFGRDLGPLLAAVATESVSTYVLVLDDLDDLDDPMLLPVFEQLARDDRLRLCAALEPRTGFTANPLVGLARRARRSLVLQPDDPAEFLQLTGIRLSLRPGLRMPPGRGVLLVDRVATVVHVTDAAAAQVSGAAA